jgi:hypothetical protein
MTAGADEHQIGVLLSGKGEQPGARIAGLEPGGRVFAQFSAEAHKAVTSLLRELGADIVGRGLELVHELLDDVQKKNVQADGPPDGRAQASRRRRLRRAVVSADDTVWHRTSMTPRIGRRLISAVERRRQQLV